MSGIIVRWQCTDTLFNALTSFLTMCTITNDNFSSDWSRQDSEMEQVLDGRCSRPSLCVPVMKYIRKQQTRWSYKSCSPNRSSLSNCTEAKLRYHSHLSSIINQAAFIKDSFQSWRVKHCHSPSSSTQLESGSTSQLKVLSRIFKTVTSSVLISHRTFPGQFRVNFPIPVAVQVMVWLGSLSEHFQWLTVSTAS
jgi:hypothetical protein